MITDVGEWDSAHVVDGLQDFLITLEMVLFAIAHRYAFPHTDYIHYLKRHGTKSARRKKRNSPTSSVQSEEKLFLFDQDQNAVNNPSHPSGSEAVDVEYEPPSVRQLDRPMSVSRALMGVAPTETFSDIANIARMGSVTVGEGNAARGSRSNTVSLGTDIVYSREHAEGI